jgi:hypothetical protein
MGDGSETPTDVGTAMGDMSEVGAEPVEMAEGGEQDPVDGMTEEEKKKIVAEVKKNYSEWKESRKKYESRWFLAGAMLRGNQHVEYNESLGQLTQHAVPSYRVQLDLNRIRPKTRARLSKFFRSRPKAVVIPASTDAKDVLNAKATEKILDYHRDRLRLEEKYKDARLWASICGKSFWWFSIDPTTLTQVRTQDPETGQTTTEDVPLGDVLVEVGSAFEVLVADPAVMRLGDQTAIQRIRMLPTADVKQRFPKVKLKDSEESSTAKDVSYTDRLATLRKDGSGQSEVKRGAQTLVIEQFNAPCAKYPKGRKAVVVEDQLAKYALEMPYGMNLDSVNPYPAVEFTDSLSPGQFWCTTYVEQMIDVQRQYNYLFELLAENIRACARPKFIVYRQHNLANGAWTTAAGEIVELTYVPGLPPPQVLAAPNIAGDVWNLIAYYDRMFDEITQIYPSSEGAVAKSTSGFQTNLLQEATDTVHAPDVREDELTLQDAAWKIRRLCKLWYDVPRLFSVLGSNSLPEVQEFSESQIDEHAEVRVQIGSMLPDLKAAKAQSALEYYKAGLLGDPADPRVRRRALDLVDMGGMEVAAEDDRRDVDEAERENIALSKGEIIRAASFHQDQITHVDRHQNLMKSSAFQQFPPEVQQGVVAHVITHYDWVNPQMAIGLRQQYGINVTIATPPPPPPPPVPPGMQGPEGAPLGSAPDPQAPSLPGEQTLGPPPSAASPPPVTPPLGPGPV